MRLIYRGRYAGAEQLPKADLPPSAVPFREPADTAALNLAAMKWSLGALALAAIFGAATIPLRGGLGMGFGFRVTAGCAASFLTLLPHELLHGLCFGRGAEVHLFVSPKDLMAFVVCTRPIYEQTAAYGHFGRTDVDLPWEHTDMAEALKAAL